ncbi:MAG: alpha-L-fucosidase, partial [Defluviitaleaceae bacterium]|nr:alpha-L-fucosidase [Defluviitaleaceae bacterium]
EDFYFKKSDDTNMAYPRNAPNEVALNWFLRTKDLVERYDPDIIYMDGALPFGDVGRAMCANYYNHNVKVNGRQEAVNLIKDIDHIFPDLYHGDYRKGIATDDWENGLPGRITDVPFQTDTHAGDWFYNQYIPYKSANELICMLIDVVSQNGCMLLNFPIKPDGTFDDECMKLIETFSNWIGANGEGIFATRPWRAHAEGPVRVEEGAFKEQNVNYTSEDFRFTKKGGSLYAFGLKRPEDGKLLIKSLAADGKNEKITNAALLGGGQITWEQTPEGLRAGITKEGDGLPYTIKIDFK